jgi:hypothetical protein
MTDKMENLTLQEPSPSEGAQMPPVGRGIPPPQNQQLPPQMFTTAAQLLDMTDSKTLNIQSPWLFSEQPMECCKVPSCLSVKGETQSQRGPTKRKG